jgi:hypothetical protein
MNVTWYKGDELLMNDEKHTFQQGEDNWYRVIISDISAEDQGIYYAFVENCSISVNLVVEGIFLAFLAKKVRKIQFFC